MSTPSFPSHNPTDGDDSSSTNAASGQPKQDATGAQNTQGVTQREWGFTYGAVVPRDEPAQPGAAPIQQGGPTNDPAPTPPTPGPGVPGPASSPMGPPPTPTPPQENNKGTIKPTKDKPERPNPWDASARWDQTFAARAKRKAPPAAPMKAAPEGWPVASYSTYMQAMKAVNALVEERFPVEEISIVGVNPLEVQRVVDRLTWPRVLLRGGVVGGIVGVFFGYLLFTGIAPEAGTALAGIVSSGVWIGIALGALAAGFSFKMSKNQPRYRYRTELVSRRYDVICTPELATIARDIIVRSDISND